jgi:hypothetical protein
VVVLLLRLELLAITPRTAEVGAVVPLVVYKPCGTLMEHR